MGLRFIDLLAEGVFRRDKYVKACWTHSGTGLQGTWGGMKEDTETEVGERCGLFYNLGRVERDAK